MRLCGLAARVRHLVADALTYLLQPVPGPRKLEPKQRQPHGYDHECGAGRYDHDCANDQQRGADNGNHDASGKAVCDV